MGSIDYGIILLAAGTSSRLGRPKQLLAYKGKSLLRHAVDEAIESGSKQLIVVLGANCDEVEKEAVQPGVKIIKNDRWQEGMASSIHKGLTEMLKMIPTLEAVIFVVCDQPFVTKTLLKDLVKEYELSTKTMVACAYGDSVGTPALFDKTNFASLLELEGDAGAKKVLKAFPELISTINFPEGSIDIDTIADYEKLVAGNDV
ncbi:MAG: nucleotidyltransferase family protein [Ferruginibacter sp.]